MAMHWGSVGGEGRDCDGWLNARGACCAYGIPSGNSLCQCPAIANFQRNFRKLTSSRARKFPVAFLEIYVWAKLPNCSPMGHHTNIVGSTCE